MSEHTHYEGLGYTKDEKQTEERLEEMKEPSVETKIKDMIELELTALNWSSYPNEKSAAKVLTPKILALLSTQQAQMRESLIERLQEELVGCSDHKTLEMVLNILEEK